VPPIRILAPAVGVYGTRTTARTGRCLLLAAAAGASVMQPVTPGRFRMSEEVEKRVGWLARRGQWQQQSLAAPCLLRLAAAVPAAAIPAAAAVPAAAAIPAAAVLKAPPSPPPGLLNVRRVCVSFSVCAPALGRADKQHPRLHELPPGLCAVEDRRAAAPARSAQDALAAAARRGDSGSGSGAHPATRAAGGLVNFAERQGCWVHHAARESAQGGQHDYRGGPDLAPRRARPCERRPRFLCFPRGRAQ
jgi:hypothetical protein